MNLNTTVKRIKNLKIQGAANIAKAAVKALGIYASKIKSKDSKLFFKELEKAKLELFNSRPTEPEMRNYLNYILFYLKKSNLGGVYELKRLTKKLVKEILEIRNNNFEKLTEYGSTLIKKNFIVYTHCHSSSVTQSLIKAKKPFAVHNTETRPKFQGRKTARELAKNKIKVIHYVDSGMNLALKKADLVMLGADSVTTTHFINKIGTSMVVDIADKLGIPIYVCTASLSFNAQTIHGKDEVIEQRQAREVWISAPKGIKIINPAFERIKLEKVTAIVSDLGILKPDTFIQEAMNKYPWLA
ncbi:MAG: hypothetical protein U9Q69_01630 [Nanoarchaeota archaeon]|nr:hypothetical protein [Nanoarchaeota archaeon]